MDRESLAADLIRRGGFDAAGLTVGPFSPDLLPLMNEWSAAHGMHGLSPAGIPPLGMIASDDSGPLAALWCFECYGVGIAYLEYALTRPGIGLAMASNALGMLACVLMAMAGSRVVPEAHYHTFRACGRLANFRVLKRIGFESAGSANQFVLCLH